MPDVAPKYFAPGRPIAHRSVDRDARIVLTALPQIVVRDDPDLIATFMPSGALGKRRSGERGGGPRGRHLVRWDGGPDDWSAYDLTLPRP